MIAGATQIQQQIHSLAYAAPGSRWMATGEGKIVKIGFATSLIERTRAWFTSRNRSNPHVVEYELIRLLADGAAANLFSTQSDLDRIIGAARQFGLIKGNRNSENYHPQLNGVIDLISQQIVEKTAYEANVYHDLVEKFYEKNKSRLKALFPQPIAPIHAAKKISNPTPPPATKGVLNRLRFFFFGVGKQKFYKPPIEQLPKDPAASHPTESNALPKDEERAINNRSPEKTATVQASESVPPPADAAAMAPAAVTDTPIVQTFNQPSLAAETQKAEKTSDIAPPVQVLPTEPAKMESVADTTPTTEPIPSPKISPKNIEAEKKKLPEKLQILQTHATTISLVALGILGLSILAGLTHRISSPEISGVSVVPPESTLPTVLRKGFLNQSSDIRNPFGPVNLPSGLTPSLLSDPFDAQCPNHFVSLNVSSESSDNSLEGDAESQPPLPLFLTDAFSPEKPPIPFSKPSFSAWIKDKFTNSETPKQSGPQVQMLPSSIEAIPSDPATTSEETKVVDPSPQNPATDSSSPQFEYQLKSPSPFSNYTWLEWLALAGTIGGVGTIVYTRIKNRSATPQSGGSSAASPPSNPPAAASSAAVSPPTGTPPAAVPSVVVPPPTGTPPVTASAEGVPLAIAAPLPAADPTVPPLTSDAAAIAAPPASTPTPASTAVAAALPPAASTSAGDATAIASPPAPAPVSASTPVISGGGAAASLPAAALPIALPPPPLSSPPRRSSFSVPPKVRGGARPRSGSDPKPSTGPLSASAITPPKNGGGAPSVARNGRPSALTGGHAALAPATAGAMLPPPPRPPTSHAKKGGAVPASATAVPATPTNGSRHLNGGGSAAAPATVDRKTAAPTPTKPETTTGKYEEGLPSVRLDYFKHIISAKERLSTAGSSVWTSGFHTKLAESDLNGNLQEVVDFIQTNAAYVNQIIATATDFTKRRNLISKHEIEVKNISETKSSDARSTLGKEVVAYFAGITTVFSKFHLTSNRLKKNNSITAMEALNAYTTKLLDALEQIAGYVGTQTQVGFDHPDADKIPLRRTILTGITAIKTWGRGLQTHFDKYMVDYRKLSEQDGRSTDPYALVLDSRPGGTPAKRHSPDSATRHTPRPSPGSSKGSTPKGSPLSHPARRTPTSTPLLAVGAKPAHSRDNSLTALPPPPVSAS